MIPQDVIDNIINTANIVDVIGDYVKLKSWSKLQGSLLIPWGQGRKPSRIPAKNIWKCFGCGKGGNVITFVKSTKGYLSSRR